MGFLGTSASFSSDFSLIVQFGLLVSILYGVREPKNERYMKHAYIMLGALTATLWSAFIVMVPKTRSLIRVYRPYTLSILVRVHMTFGILVLLIGFYLIWVWKLEAQGPCFRQKGKMKILTALWVIEILSGVLIYYLLYV